VLDWIGPGYDRMLIGGVEVSARKMRKFARKLEGLVASALQELMFGPCDVSSRAWKNLLASEDLNNTNTGFTAVPESVLVLNRLYTNPDLMSKNNLVCLDVCFVLFCFVLCCFAWFCSTWFFLLRSTDVYFNSTDRIWKQTPALKYLSVSEQCLEWLLALIHLTSGLPARSTEIQTLRLRNVRGSQRSFFFSQSKAGL